MWGKNTFMVATQNAPNSCRGKGGCTVSMGAMTCAASTIPRTSLVPGKLQRVDQADLPLLMLLLDGMAVLAVKRSLFCRPHGDCECMQASTAGSFPNVGGCCVELWCGRSQPCHISDDISRSGSMPCLVFPRVPIPKQEVLYDMGTALRSAAGGRERR